MTNAELQHENDEMHYAGIQAIGMLTALLSLKHLQPEHVLQAHQIITRYDTAADKVHAHLYPNQDAA